MSEPRYIRHINRIYTRVDELEEAAKAAETVLNTPGWQAIQGVLAAEAGDLDRELDDPYRLWSQAEYAQKHAYKAGLRSVQEIVAALTERADARLAQERERHEGVAAESARR